MCQAPRRDCGASAGALTFQCQGPGNRRGPCQAQPSTGSRLPGLELVMWGGWPVHRGRLASLVPAHPLPTHCRRPKCWTPVPGPSFSSSHPWNQPQGKPGHTACLLGEAPAPPAMPLRRPSGCCPLHVPLESPHHSRTLGLGSAPEGSRPSKLAPTWPSFLLQPCSPQPSQGLPQSHGDAMMGTSASLVSPRSGPLLYPLLRCGMRGGVRSVLTRPCPGKSPLLGVLGNGSCVVPTQARRETRVLPHQPGDSPCAMSS